MSKSIKLVFSYENTEDTRIYTFDADDSITAACKLKILAINASLAAGTDDGLADFFVSNAGDRLAKISDARLISVTEVPIAIGG